VRALPSLPKPRADSPPVVLTRPTVATDPSFPRVSSAERDVAFRPSLTRGLVLRNRFHITCLVSCSRATRWTGTLSPRLPSALCWPRATPKQLSASLGRSLL
jgi:hypothetical protein